MSTGLTEVMSEQVIQVNGGGGSQGRGSSQYKGPGMTVCLVCSRNGREASVTGGSWRVGDAAQEGPGPR